MSSRASRTAAMTRVEANLDTHRAVSGVVRLILSQCWSRWRHRACALGQLDPFAVFRATSFFRAASSFCTCLRRVANLRGPPRASIALDGGFADVTVRFVVIYVSSPSCRRSCDRSATGRPLLQCTQYRRSKPVKADGPEVIGSKSPDSVLRRPARVTKMECTRRNHTDKLDRLNRLNSSYPSVSY